MIKQKVAVYAGSFDPPTLGHFDIILRAAKQFDKVIVLVADNPNKRHMFDCDLRIDMIKASILDHFKEWDDFSVGKIEVGNLYAGQMLAKTAKRLGATSLVRGLRSVTDFEFEFQMALTNRHLEPDIETVFL